MRARDLTGINAYESKFYDGVATIADLVPTQSEIFDPVPNIFNNATAGVLSRSCGLVKLAERNPDFSGLTREDIGGLMGLTIEVDRLLSTSTLRAGAKSANDPFVRLILQTLLREHSPSTKDNFQFKYDFQDYVISHHDGDIVSFIKSVYQLDPAIVPYFVLFLDETMLSKIPFLVKTAEGVYETRAKVLEWYAGISGDQNSRDKAKQLRIDRKIAAVRGQINETRLNIDALRFRQWIDSTKLSDFSGLIRQEIFTIPLGFDFKGKKMLSELKLTAHRDPNVRALLAVIDCYREFCVNPDFGVASYLGRRIRHGTLRGTLLDALPEPAEYKLSASSTAQYEVWLETFRKSIEAITARLHFSGKGTPSGAVISAEIDNKDKWEILLACLKTMHEKSQADQGSASLIVEQYCWYIFEVELRHVQNAIAEARSEFGVFKMKHAALEQKAIGFEKSVNIALANRFNTVASWFHKPPNISPVAEISDIVEVTLRETRAEFPDFNPEPRLIGTKFELSGGVYYHVYDALSVIVRNAGKHGDHPGTLEISAQVDEHDLRRILTIDVISRTKTGDSGAKAAARMAKAGLAGPVGADVVEGWSGTRKLQKMQMDKALLDFKYRECQDSPSEIKVSVVFPLTGIV
ncbi:hypothetical protein GKA01_22790 [Gluconobacter kanchanaburiensis NBRC 103587]|uniref:Uncharacterized protein n=2 Tax=Gluconobacter kanchanaburiensis TaxID=563199 RepID=A0A511BBB7_9PROT|nr:hypothetical protein AA103587_1125 [Gluconobacter kanchanaburiensis NBRC 103587]GEK97082.1 hypothetical protein GKA01_22790 [Gluconobacter kanchanaburiensis NBRC 103587]